MTLYKPVFSSYWIYNVHWQQELEVLHKVRLMFYINSIRFHRVHFFGGMQWCLVEPWDHHKSSGSGSIRVNCHCDTSVFNKMQCQNCKRIAGYISLEGQVCHEMHFGELHFEFRTWFHDGHDFNSNISRMGTEANAKRDYRLLRSKERAIVPYFYSNVYNCFLMNNVQGINIFQAWASSGLFACYFAAKQCHIWQRDRITTGPIRWIQK